MALHSDIITWTPVDDDGRPIRRDKRRVRASLTLDGPIRLKAGLKPDLWSARLPYTEFATIEPDLARRGIVEMWYTAPPDLTNDVQPTVTLAGVRVVDVEATKVGLPAGAAAEQVTEYRLTFADFREGLLAPRGGRLRVGYINPEAKKPAAGTKTTATKKKDDKVKVELTYAEMLVKCLQAMGVDKPTLPQPKRLAKIEPPRDVKWLGNHAPTELAKLLEWGGLVYVPHLDGTGSVEWPGEGKDPVVPAGESIPEFQVPSIDRRGKSVLFSSYPNRNLITLVLLGPKATTWEFVIQDKDNAWVPIDQAAVFGGKDPVEHVHNFFQDVEAQYRDRVRKQAYRHIRLSEDAYPPELQPVLTEAVNTDGTTDRLEVWGQIAVYDRPTGLWQNTDEFVLVGAKFVGREGNIVQLNGPAGRVTQSTTNPDRDFKALAFGQLRVRFAIEDAEKGPDGKLRPKYFHCGFRLDANKTLLKLTADEIALALDGKGDDAVVFTRPDLRLWIVNNEEINRTGLEQTCHDLAEQYLANSGSPTRLVSARGYQPIDPSGLVSQVQWDQQDLRTTATLLDWWTPLGAVAGGVAKQSDLEEDFPNQGKTEAARNALGESGSARQVRAVSPRDGPEPPAAGGLVLVNLGQDGGEDGDASTTPATACTWTYTATDRLTGQVLGTKLSPIKGRLFKQSMTKADKGVGQAVTPASPEDPSFLLWDVNEVASDQTKCS